MENLSHNIEELYQQVREQSLAEGVLDQEAYDTIVDDVLEQYRTTGEMHDDEEYENFKEILKSRWSEFSQDIEIHE